MHIPSFTRRSLLLTGIGFFILAVLARLLPHPPNFTPIAAIALTGGACFGGKRGLAVPLAALFASDLVLGLYDIRIMAAVYAGMTAAAFIGAAVREKRNAPVLAASAIVSSILFFLVTNAAVWAWGGLYPRTIHGLFDSYVAGLPFFRNSLMGDLSYTLVIWAVLNAALRSDPAFRTKRQISAQVMR